MKKNFLLLLKVLLVCGWVLFALTSAWAQDTGILEEEFKCPNNTSIRVKLQNNVPIEAKCIYADGVIITAREYTDRTYLYLNIDGVNVFFPDTGFKITNAGDPPGGLVCLDNQPLWVYSNKLFRCLRK